MSKGLFRECTQILLFPFHPKIVNPDCSRVVIFTMLSRNVTLNLFTQSSLEGIVNMWIPRIYNLRTFIFRKKASMLLQRLTPLKLFSRRFRPCLIVK